MPPLLLLICPPARPACLAGHACRYGMLCAMLATGIWLLLATYLELPVSTTHSITGAVIGMSCVAGGFDSGECALLSRRVLTMPTPPAHAAAAWLLVGCCPMLCSPPERQCCTQPACLSSLCAPFLQLSGAPRKTASLSYLECRSS